MGVKHLVEFPRLGLEFTVNETAIQIGNFSVKWYGILIGIGFLLAIAYGFANAKRQNINQDKLLDAIIWGLIAGVIGARLYYVIFYPGTKYIDNPIEILKIHSGGLAFYGGLIGAVIAAFIVSKVRKINLPALLDLVAIGFLIGQAVGRWGNFINQEAFGTVTDLPWGMSSDNTSFQTVHPCFLYESLLCFIGFIALHFFNRKFRRYDGQTFILYIIWYGFIRFFIEGLRTDSLYFMDTGIRISQLLSALAVIAGIIVLIIFRNRTSLSGTGSKKIMELRGVVIGEETASEPETTENTSTIFGDLTEQERKDIFGASVNDKKIDVDKAESESKAVEADKTDKNSGQES